MIKDTFLCLILASTLILHAAETPNIGMRKTLISRPLIAYSRIFFTLPHSFHTLGTGLEQLELSISSTFHDIENTYEIVDFCFIITCEYGCGMWPGV